MFIINKNQLSELENLCSEIKDMSLPKNNATQSQLSKVEELILRNIKSDIWNSCDFSSAIDEEYAVIINDPQKDNIMILIVIWPGNISSCIHNHLTWSVVGVIHGIEENKTYKLHSNHNSKKVKLVKCNDQILHSGDVCTMDENVIHSVTNHAPNNYCSCSLHIYGDDLRKNGRQIFDLKTQKSIKNPNKEFITLKSYKKLFK